MSSLLSEFRCVCGQLLFRGFLNDSFLEIKCKRCKKVVSVSNLSPDNKTERYFLLYDSDGVVVDACSTEPTILGYTRKDLLGGKMGHIDLHVGEGSYDHFWDKAQMIRFDPHVTETFHKHKNGEFVCVQEHIRFQTVAEKSYALVSHEVVKKENGFMFQPTIVPNGITLSGPIAEINIDGFFTYVSNEFARELMYDIPDMIGKSFFYFCPEEIIKIFTQNFSSLLHDCRSFSVPHIELVKKDRMTAKYNLSFIATYQKDNSLRGFVVVSTLPISVDSLRPVPVL